VVGVIADEKIGGLHDDRSAGVYVSSEQSPVYSVILVVRAALDPRRLEKAIRQAIAGVNQEQVINDVRTVDQIKDQSAVGTRLATMLLAIFSAISLLLSAIGIYGVINYSVVQRAQEMGVRAALGAPAASPPGLVLRRGLVLTVIGLVIGLGGTLAVTQLLTMLYGIGPRDPATIASVAAVLAAVAVMACYIPARRATRIDPMVALRYE
jgi:putative ABC transport system permease protein